MANKISQEERDQLIQEGRNQVLYLMLVIGDENVEHDNWRPQVADILYKARVEICQMLKHPKPDGRGVMNTFWPRDGEWPDFEKYTYTPG
jgi:hypothetical protein